MCAGLTETAAGLAFSSYRMIDGGNIFGRRTARRAGVRMDDRAQQTKLLHTFCRQ